MLKEVTHVLKSHINLHQMEETQQLGKPQAQSSPAQKQNVTFNATPINATFNQPSELNRTTNVQRRPINQTYLTVPTINAQFSNNKTFDALPRINQKVSPRLSNAPNAKFTSNQQKTSLTVRPNQAPSSNATYNCHTQNFNSNPNATFDFRNLNRTKTPTIVVENVDNTKGEKMAISF
jgi:hypothetical protein